jgi:hypothetical protein
MYNSTALAIKLVELSVRSLITWAGRPVQGSGSLRMGVYESQKLCLRSPQVPHVQQHDACVHAVWVKSPTHLTRNSKIFWNTKFSRLSESKFAPRKVVLGLQRLHAQHMWKDMFPSYWAREHNVDVRVQYKLVEQPNYRNVDAKKCTYHRGCIC